MLLQALQIITDIMGKQLAGSNACNIRGFKKQYTNT